MNSTSQYNDNNYSESTNVPICTGLGFWCPELYSLKRLASYFATIGNVIIIPFALYLTFAKVKDGFFKYFTLNLMANCITTALAIITIDTINVASLFTSLRGNKSYLHDIREWARFYVGLGSIWFHALALYVVIVCYLPYVKPTFYVNNFVRKSQKMHYAILHISALIWSNFVTLLLKEFRIFLPYFLTHILLFITLFILALMGSFKIYSYKPLGNNSARIAKLQQKRLHSFILYSYSLEIITLPMFIHSCSHVFCTIAGHKYRLCMSNIKVVLSIAIYFLYEMRTIIIVAVTILALEPYRRATFALFQKKKWDTKVSSIHKF